MKFLLCCAGVSLIALSAATATQQPEDRDTCHFKVSESTPKAAITGPEDIVAMAHVVEQPDSPLEIVAMDFKDSFVSVVNEQFTEQLQCTARIHNRSDQWIRGLDIVVLVATDDYGRAGSGSGFVGPGRGGSLAPGQEMEISACGGRGTGGAPSNHVRILVFVSSIAMDDCSYLPSQRYPRRFGAS